MLRLTVGRDEKGRILAIATEGGHPQVEPDAPTVVQSIEVVRNMKEAKAWFRRMKVERPWETRQ